LERVLVCLLASTRSHKLSFPSFKRQVLDQLGGDLALALLIDEKYDYANPYWQHAKYRWTSPIYSDYGEAFDLVQRWLCQQYQISKPPDWREMLQIKGVWQGGIRSSDPQPSASSILPFCRWLLLSGMQRDEVLDRYDRFVITRSDFVWLCPHPPLSVLDRDFIWVPDGEDHSGLNDRHLVASRDNISDCLNMIEEILLHPHTLYQEMRDVPDHFHWNDEMFLKYQFRRKGLIERVRRFPYVMYTARAVDDESPTWRRGRYEPAVGHYLKYEKEYFSASAYATIIHSRADWESGAWRKIVPLPPVRPPLQRLRYAGESAYFSVRSALRRPGRVARFGRFLGRAIGLKRVSDD